MKLITEKQYAVLVDSLKFYADQHNYDSLTDDEDLRHTKMNKDHGAIARMALEFYQDEEERNKQRIIDEVNTHNQRLRDK